MTITFDIATPIKQTTSLCPTCLRQVDATVYGRDQAVYMRKQCPEHGEFDVLINSDRRYYYKSIGVGPGGAGGCGASCACVGHDDSLIEHASTCIALIEIVTSCNLKCPTCYADSPYAPPAAIDALPIDEVRSRLEAVIARKGAIDILQLSGGEPTVHPSFFDILRWAQSHEGIGYTLVNTNGVRVARDDVFARELGRLRRGQGGFELYLQFDGTQEAGQRELRGADLRAMRESVCDRCQSEGVPVTLAMTVNEDNLNHIGDTLRFGLSRRAVRGVTFQPMFGSGRVGGSIPRRLNVADLLVSLIDQSRGLLTDADFTPLPCGDPNCHTVGYLLRRGDDVIPVSRVVDFSKVQGFLSDRVDFNLEDLSRCGCETEPLGSILKQFEVGPDDVFRLFIKPFMDAWTYDQHRIDRCCVHVVGEAGRLESFCRHYAMQD